MHLVMLASTHPPTDARILYRESLTVRDAGHKVTVLTMANGNYTSESGIRFEIVSRPRNRFLRVLKGRYLMKRALELDADIYIVHDPEILHASNILTRNGKKYIYDAHEPYPDFLAEKDWVPGILRKPVKKFVAREELKGAVNASGLIVAMSENKERLRKANRPVLTLHNYPRYRDITPEMLKKDKSVIYLGGIMDVRFGREIISMARHFNEGSLLEGWQLKVIGPIHDINYRNSCLQDSNPYQTKPYFDFHPGFMKYSMAMKEVERASFGLSLVRPTRNYSQIVSSKVFDYMAKGTIPVATWLPSYNGLVSEEDGPVFIEPGEEERVPEIIANIAADEEAMRQRAERCIQSVREKFNWEIEGKELPGFLERIVENKS